MGYTVAAMLPKQARGTFRNVLQNFRNKWPPHLVGYCHMSNINCDSPFKLISSLREDYRRRSPYLGYLVRCRQGLLSSLSHQTRLVSRIDADRTVCSRHLVRIV